MKSRHTRKSRWIRPELSRLAAPKRSFADRKGNVIGRLSAICCFILFAKLPTSPAESLQVHVFCEQENRAKLDSPQTVGRASTTLQDLQTSEEKAKHIMDSYHRARSEFDVGAEMMRLNSFILGKATEYGGTVAAAEGNVPAAILLYTANKASSAVENLYLEQGEADIKHLLATSVDRYKKEHPDDFADFQNSSTTAESFQKGLKEKYGPLVDNILPNLKDQDKPVVQAQITQMFVETFKTGIGSLAGVTALNSNEIAATQEHLAGLSTRFCDWVEKTQGKLAQLTDDVSNVKSVVQGLDQRVTQTEQGVEMLQDLAFSKLDPADRAKALQNQSFLPNLPPEERERLLRESTVAAEHAKLENDISSYIGSSQELYHILSDQLHINSPIVDDLGKATNIAGESFKAFTSFASGDFLGGVSAALSVFGFGGPDAAALRHQEEMQAIKQVAKDVHAVKQELDVVDQKVDAVLQNQTAELHVLGDISGQISSSFNQLMDKNDELQASVQRIEAILDSSFRRHYQQCLDCCTKREDPSAVVLDPVHGVYPSYAWLHDRLAGQAALIAGLKTFFFTVREQDDRFGAEFSLAQSENKALGELQADDSVVPSEKEAAAQNVNKRLRSATENYGDLLRRYLRNFTSVTGDAQLAAVTHLMMPALTVEALRVKHMTMNLSSGYLRYMAQDPESLIRRMDVLISPTIARRHGFSAARFHFIAAITDGSGNILSQEKIKGQSSLDENSAIQILLEALRLEDTAVAQQALLCGDELLWVLYQNLVQPHNEKSPGIPETGVVAPSSRLSQKIGLDSVVTTPALTFYYTLPGSLSHVTNVPVQLLSPTPSTEAPDSYTALSSLLTANARTHLDENFMLLLTTEEMRGISNIIAYRFALSGQSPDGLKACFKHA